MPAYELAAVGKVMLSIPARMGQIVFIGFVRYVFVKLCCAWRRAVVNGKRSMECHTLKLFCVNREADRGQVGGMVEGRFIYRDSEVLMFSNLIRF